MGHGLGKRHVKVIQIGWSTKTITNKEKLAITRSSYNEAAATVPPGDNAHGAVRNVEKLCAELMRNANPSYIKEKLAELDHADLNALREHLHQLHNFSENDIINLSFPYTSERSTNCRARRSR